MADFLRGAPGGAAAATVTEPVAAEPAGAADPAPPAEVDAGLIDSLTRRS